MAYELRLATATEETLQECVRRKIWAARKKLPRNWAKGQLLMIRIKSQIAALAVIRGEIEELPKRSFSDQFPLSAPVDWVWVAENGATRPDFGNWIQEELHNAWGEHYGFRILNQTILPVRQATRILNKFEKKAGILLQDLLLSSPVTTGSR